MFWAENLTKEGMIEFVKPRPRNAHEGEFYWEERNRDLHVHNKGAR